VEDNVIRLCVNGRKMEPGMNVQLYTLRDFTLMANWRLNGISAEHSCGGTSRIRFRSVMNAFKTAVPWPRSCIRLAEEH
jgi:hypothetical protein